MFNTLPHVQVAYQARKRNWLILGWGEWFDVSPERISVYQGRKSSQWRVIMTAAQFEILQFEIGHISSELKAEKLKVKALNNILEIRMATAEVATTPFERK